MILNTFDVFELFEIFFIIILLDDDDDDAVLNVILFAIALLLPGFLITPWARIAHAFCCKFSLLSTRCNCVFVNRFNESSDVFLRNFLVLFIKSIFQRPKKVLMATTTLDMEIFKCLKTI